MDYERFIALVQGAAGVDRERAEHATRATLLALAERIDVGESRDLATQLPAELAPFVGRVGGAEGFSVDEFVRRVAERESVDAREAERDARAVFAALGQAVSARELDDMRAQLSSDFAPLLPRGPEVDVLPADEFALRVAERAGLDEDGGSRAAEAFLETLAERIAGGEVDDLVERLPLALRGPLRRARDRGGSPARASLDDFVRRVAERAGVDELKAREVVRAGLATLRDAVGEEEFRDVTVQLPQEYHSVFPRPSSP